MVVENWFLTPQSQSFLRLKGRTDHMWAHVKIQEMATDDRQHRSAWRVGWASTNRAHHGITFSWGVDVMMMALGGIIGELMVPDAPTALERASYPGVGGVLGFVLGVILIFSFFTVFAYARQNFIHMVTQVITDVSQALNPDQRAIPQMSQSLNQDQIAERQLFITRLRSAAMQLEKNTHYNIPGSAAQRFNVLCGTSEAQEVIQKDEMTGWVSRLLDGQFIALAMRCWDSEQRSDALLPSSLTDDSIRLEVGRIANSVRDYRQLILQFIAFIHALEERGMPQIGENIMGLVDGYDELMRLMRDLRNATPRDIRSGLPTDEQLSNFPEV